MNIFEEIKKIANRGIAIDYVIVINEIDEKIGFTISLWKESSFSGELIDGQNFDELEKGLEWGINKAKEKLGLNISDIEIEMK